MKRAAVVLLGIAVLSAWGMPFHPPCCGFRDSTRTSVASNCCPIEGCPLAQARGAAPAAIVSADLIGAPLSAIEGMIGTVPLPVGAPRREAPGFSDSPPRARPTAARLSVFRI